MTIDGAAGTLVGDGVVTFSIASGGSSHVVCPVSTPTTAATTATTEETRPPSRENYLVLLLM